METWLEELSEAVCQHHLARALIGRLAVVVDGHPEVFPVNHVVDDETGDIVFPSNRRTKLYAALHGPVAFEADGVDDGGKSAWSVVAFGRGEDITGTDEAARAMARRVPLWAVGDYTHWVRVTPERITGRRISVIG